MFKKYELGFTLVEVVIAALIIVVVTSSIMYGVATTDNSLRNVELRHHAFMTLSNKMEEFKAQVALNRIQSSSDRDRRVCIEYKTIRDMVNKTGIGTGCRTIGYLSHNIRNRRTESNQARIYDIEASLKYKVMSRFGRPGKDSIIKLNVSQLVFK
jgi:Tfp pilus assembly protein PilE